MTKQNPVGMTDMVAADFNRRFIKDSSPVSSVGTTDWFDDAKKTNRSFLRNFGKLFRTDSPE